MNRDIIILLIISTLLTIPVVHTIGQSIHIPQNKAAIENFTLNEDDTLRYAHHYLYERAYQVIADMLTDKRSVDMADAFRCVCAGEIASVLDADSIAAWKAQQKADTFYCAIVADLHKEELLLVDIQSRQFYIKR